MSSRARRRRKVEPKRSPLPRLALLLGLAAGAGLLLVWAAMNAGGNTAEPAARTLTAPTGTTPEGYAYKGSQDAPVTVIEYADFQCPACAYFFRELEDDLDRQYVETGQVRLEFREFPLPQHPNAVVTAEAARCAGVQGKFWPMHDLLFSRQRQWQSDRNITPRLVGYATEVGIDPEAFGQCLESNQFEAVVTSAGQAAVQAGVSATPTFVIGDQMVDANGVMPAIEAAVNGAGQ